MEKVFISHSRHPRLILLFLGWGMDATPFAGLYKNGYDILAVSDYTGYQNQQHPFADLLPLLSTYREIVVAAWSFGVRIAADFLNHASQLPVTRTLAINGTETHIHDTRGIPHNIFNGTLDNLSPQTVRKFQRRMFGSAAAFATFQQNAPHRTFESMLGELKTFAEIPPASPARWDRAIIGNDDAIFPPDNQARAWQAIPADKADGMTHFPDFQKILDLYVIDKDLVAERFSNAQITYRNNASPQQASALKLWNLAGKHLPAAAPHIRLLEIGVGEGLLTELYLPLMRSARITLWDIAKIPPLTLPPQTIVECCDAETAIRHLPDESIDLILSSSTLQWFNSPAEFIRETARVLRRGGIAAFSLFGPETYREITEAAGTSLRYPTSRQLLDAAKATSGLETLECREEITQSIFQNVAEVLRHIKTTGVNAISRDAAANSSAAIKLMRHYPVTAEGAAPLTYHSIHMVFKKPCPN